MLQWLRLTVLLLLSVAVSGREIKCDEVRYAKNCWNSQAHSFSECWSCEFKNQSITESDEVLTILPALANGTVTDVEFVTFSYGNVNKVPNVIYQGTNKQIVRVFLWKTNTRVLNVQFFGNVAENFKFFESFGNENLSLEASAFQNCESLKYLSLVGNGISSIPPDAFLGLHKLIRLNLDDNQLSLLNADWSLGLDNLEILNLSGNQLKDIPIDNLRKLRSLDVYGNKIEIVSRIMFQNNEQLQRIDLQKNQIKLIQSGTFAGLKKLSWLYLRGNKCTNSDFQNNKLKEISAGLTACHFAVCVIPQIANGFLINTEDNATQTTGDSFEESKTVRVVCRPSFSLICGKETQPENSCMEDNWTRKKWPECHRK